MGPWKNGDPALSSLPLKLTAGCWGGKGGLSSFQSILRKKKKKREGEGEEGRGGVDPEEEEEEMAVNGSRGASPCSGGSGSQRAAGRNGRRMGQSPGCWDCCSQIAQLGEICTHPPSQAEVPEGRHCPCIPSVGVNFFFDVLALSHTALILLLPAGLAGSHRWGWRFGLRLAASFQPISAVPGGVCRVQVMRRALGEALLSDDAGLLR